MKTKALFLISMALCMGLAACAKKSSKTTDTSASTPVDTGGTGGGGGGGTGGGGGGGSTTPSPKILASVWTVTNSSWSIDWTAARVDGTEFTMTLTMSDHVSQCVCGITANGTAAAASCSVTTPCTYVPGSGSNPGCHPNTYGMCAGGGFTMDGTNLSFNAGASYH